MNAWAIMQGICTAAQWAWNAAMTANPVGIIIVAIGVVLWMNWDSVCVWCKQAFQAVGDFFVSVGTSIGSFFVGLWTGIKDTAVGVWNGITGFLSGAWNTNILRRCFCIYGNRKCDQECVERHRRCNKQHYIRN